MAATGTIFSSALSRLILVDPLAYLDILRSVIKQLVKLIRVYQWTKSGFIFLPFVFSDYLFQIKNNPFSDASFGLYIKLLMSFFGFSFLASSVYILNDWKDRAEDRLDPRKMHRPFAAGTVPGWLGLTLAAVLFSTAMFFAYSLSRGALLVFSIYFVMNIFYSLIGKRIVLLDVFIIAIGFVLRVIGGAFSLSIEASPWLLSCTFFVALFLGFFKRFYEVKVGPAEILMGGVYNAESLRHFINITAGLSIMNYSIYSLQGKHADAQLVWTIPLVVLGIFRYYMLMQSPEDIEDGNPSDLLLADKFLILIILSWIALCAVLILYVPSIR